MFAGESVGHRFLVEAEVDRGGSGVVHRAIDRHTGRPVALKLLAVGAAATSSDLDRFAREARLLAELRHPGIVGYVAHGHSASGQPFIAMEWLDGEDLGRRLARGPLDVRGALRVVRSAAEALAVAHRRGVVHRDLKPSNIFLRDGRLESAVLLDFGIARPMRGITKITATGAVLGTPDYMAPEQARGDEIGPAADVFALGSVL
jgi:eukaryotic-like serine/threonine-protein kinase